MRQKLCAAAAVAVLLLGCSSRPRNFEPVLAAAPADQSAYQSHLRNCQVIVATGGWKDGRGVSAAGGAVAGVGAGVATGSAVAAGTSGMIGAAAAAAAAAAVALPVVGVLGAWGISKIKKSKNERQLKSELSQCLASGGYSVDRWRAMSKKEVRALPELRAALECKKGPLAKSVGGHPWLVYSCSDGASLVFASAPGNPASPFYFFVKPDGDGLAISGTGNGSKEASTAAFQDLKALSLNDVRAIVAETKRKQGSAKPNVRPTAD